MTPRLVHASAMATGVALLTTSGLSGVLSDLARYSGHGDARWWLFRGYVGAFVIGLTAVGVGALAFYRFTPRPAPSAVATMNFLIAAALLGNSLIMILGDTVLAAEKEYADLAAHAFAFLLALCVRLVWKKEQQLMAQPTGVEP